MKKQIRVGVFETNSSMTHALTICTQEEYDKWQNGETLLNRYAYDDDNQFITNDDNLIEKLKKQYDNESCKWYDTFEEFLHSEGIDSYDTYDEDCYFEHYEKTFTTPSGDKMVAFGYYGHD